MTWLYIVAIYLFPVAILVTIEYYVHRYYHQKTLAYIYKCMTTAYANKQPNVRQKPPPPPLPKDGAPEPKKAKAWWPSKDIDKQMKGEIIDPFD